MSSLPRSDVPDLVLRQIQLSRRALLGAPIVLGVALGSSSASSARAAVPAGAGDPGSWRPWLLASAAEVRPAAPPPASRAEIAELLDLQTRRTARELDLIARWGARPAVLPWTQLTLDLITAHEPTPVRAARALALLQVAVYDAVVATWDAKGAYPSRMPAAEEPALTIIADENTELASSSFPSEHAAVAGVASAVLPYLFPASSANWLAELADEAAMSRLWAGANYRSDVEAGFEIGRAVGARAVARGPVDGSETGWDEGTRPIGDGVWQPTPPGFVDPPLDPQAGTWRPWVVANGQELRPAPPPAHDSPAWHAELAAVQEAVARRTAAQVAAAVFWAGSPGTVTPAGLWIEIARDLVKRDALDLPHASRVLALASVAMYDAFICCWDAKYAYWTARPITADPTLDVVIPTPPFPSYTSGHSTISAAAATVLGHLFPEDEADLAAKAAEAKNSRLWSGIHFPIDNDLGAAMGRVIGDMVSAVARVDGAERR